MERISLKLLLFVKSPRTCNENTTKDLLCIYQSLWYMLC